MAAVEGGADWIGIMLERRSPRFAADAEALRVVDAVSGRADMVGVFVEPSAAECAEAVDRYRLAAVQVHGDVDPSLVTECPVPVIRGFNVRSLAEAATLQWWPDCLVLVDVAVEGHALPGGTGRRLEPRWAAEVARHRRVILAGGLDADNVADAIRTVRPEGVDASSRLETSPGNKDAGLVRRFVRAAREASAAEADGG